MKRQHLCLGVLFLTLAFHAFIVVRNFRGPIGDHSESFLSEYLSYYLSKNLTMWPFPHLNLTNDQVFYPFGTNGALQSWCVERDLIFSLLTAAFGRGPWLQLYYMAALAVSVFGSYALLRRDFGEGRATFATVLIHLFNFYEMQKYPYHFNMSVLHWTTLGMVADFVIVRRVVLGTPVTLRLIALRILLLALSFGLELGHVLGYGLTSAFVSGLFVAGVLVYRRVRRQPLPRIEWRGGARVILAIGVATLVVTWLYGPLVAQIVRESKTYHFDDAVATWWSHPIRLLIPYFPWIHPSQQPRFLHVFRDIAEDGIGSGGAGWFLLVLAIVGVYQGRRRLGPYIPLLVMLALYVVSQPSFDPIRKLPWFAFVRVFSRATVVYSAIFGLLAIEVTLRRMAVPALAMLGGLELVTIGMIKFDHAAYVPDASVIAYTNRIKVQPGEALLDFPFCIAGGNGIGLCPFFDKLKGVYALQRFHEKKVIGQYLGRLHPSQVQPFVDAGWDRLFDPDDPDLTRANRERHCLNDVEWEFFTDFYELNDFCGIQLTVDRLPDGCAEQFYARFGRPVAEMTLARAGRLVFIPKNDRGHVDKARAKSLRLGLAPLVDDDALSARPSKTIFAEGLSSYEAVENQHWRWALGRQSTFRFVLAAPAEVEVTLIANNPLADQVITVELDGNVVERLTNLPAHEKSERKLRMRAGAGEHKITLHYQAWNGQPGHVFAPEDSRPLALQIYSFHLRTAP